MATKEGIVERVSKKNGRTGLKIDGTWYSTFEKVQVSQGERVAYDFNTVEKDGKTYRNLTGIQTLEAAARDSKEPSEGERIARSVALKCAVRTVGPGTPTVEVLDTAEEFLDFVLDRDARRSRHDAKGDAGAR